MSHPMIREITKLDANKPRTDSDSAEVDSAVELKVSSLEKAKLHRQSIIDAFYTEFFRQCFDEDTEQPLLAKDEYIRTGESGGVTVVKSH